MIPRISGGILLILAWLSPAIRSAEQPQRTSSLLQAHLKQAESVAAPLNATRTSTLDQFQKEIAQSAAAWVQRLEREELSTALLQGLSEQTIQTARRASVDNEKCLAFLQADASIGNVLALVAVRSSEIRVARENLRASLNRFEQASYLEELVSQFRSFARELDTRVGPQSHKEMPEKTFAFPSALALKGQVVDLEAGIAELQYQKAVRTALNDAARAYFEAQNAGQSAKILKESRDLFANIEALTLERLRVGHAAQADVLKAQADLAMLEVRFGTMERQQLNSIARINQLLQIPPDSTWTVSVSTDLRDPLLTLDQALKEARVDSHELRAAARETELMSAMVRMAETDLLPRGSQGYSRLAPSTGAEAGPTRSSMAAFPDRPELNANRAGFGSNAAFLQELRVRLVQSHEMKAMVLAQLEFNVKDAHFRLDAARRERSTFTETVIPKTRQALDAVRENYNTAKVPFIEYLDAARTYLTNMLALEKARMEHNQMLIELQDRRGRTAAQLLLESQ